MPLELVVHAVECATKLSPCDCNVQVFTDPAEALEAHRGDSTRLEIRAVTLPPPRLPDPVTWHRSQARRHTRPISD